jgi:4-amino-4-deoxychorismate lyase
MCLLIETLGISEGKLKNISFHNERFNRSRRELFGIETELNLESIIDIPHSFTSGKVKCTIVYSAEIISVTFSEYKIKKLDTLQFVENNSIEYSYKFKDRHQFEKLKAGIKADDIIIIKNGFVTDTSYANIVFYDGYKWVTPSSPLLHGTARSRLLAENAIYPEEIRKSDIKLFKYAKIINAMIGLEDSYEIDIKNIY